MKIIILYGALVGFLLVGCMYNGESKEFSAYVSKEGAIDLPKDFRKGLAHMGSWYVPDGDASGFHDVYTEQATIDYYRKTGNFPDGATIVKELRHGSSGNYTTGKGVAYANANIKQTFVMIKDSTNRFPGNALWGDGWGWALFTPDNKGVNVATNYKTDCLGCHVPAKQNDWIYVEAYPTLNNPE